MKITTPYYIDESGDLEEGGLSFFMLGCVIVNDTEENHRRISQLKEHIRDNLALRKHRMENGFHACENHLEIYQEFIKILFSLDFRAYIVFLDKKSGYFKELIKNCSKEEIYNKLLIHLLRPRLLKRCLNKNLLYFERQGNKMEKEKHEKEVIITQINKGLIADRLISLDLDFEVCVVEKGDTLISVVDYVLHIFSRVYNKQGKNYMERNFELIEPKIAVIHDIAKNEYYKLRNMAKSFL